MYMCLCEFVCTMYVQVPIQVRGCHRWLWVTSCGCWDLYCGFWELIQGPLQGQKELVTAEPSLQPLVSLSGKHRLYQSHASSLEWETPWLGILIRNTFWKLYIPEA